MLEYEASRSGGFTAKDISRNDLNKILSAYEDIEDIYTLGPGQRWILNAGRKNNSSFIMRMLFKADIPVDPLAFRKKVRDVCQRQEALRFAYVYRELTVPYIVVLKNRTAELHFDDLSRLPRERQGDILRRAGDSDSKRGFDLEKDPLLRITVFKLAENSHAFLLSMHHINADGTSVGLLMKEIFIDYALNIDPGDMPWAFSYRRYAKYLEGVNKQAELSYWKEYLKDIPKSSAIPGMVESAKAYRNATETLLFSEELQEKLQKAQKSFKTTRFNILSAAWSIMMNRISGTEDVVFGIMSSGREAGPDRNMYLAGGFALALPMRIRLNGEKKVSDLFREIQSELLISMKYPHCSADELDQALGRDEPVFSHILNCQNFMSGSEGTNMGIPGFQVLEVNLSGDMSCDLAACFTTTTEGEGIVFGYNAEAFSRDTVLLYGECFLKTLEAIVDEEDIRVSEAPAFDAARFEYAKNAALIADLKKVLVLKKLPDLKQLSEDDMMRLAGDVTIRPFAGDEKIFAKGDRIGDIAIILKGFVESWTERKNGWSVPAAIRKEGEILSMDALFEESVTRYSAVSYSPECEILFIPVKSFRWLLSVYPDIDMDIIKNLLTTRANLERLWIDS